MFKKIILIVCLVLSQKSLAAEDESAPRFFFADTQAFALYTGGLYYLSQNDNTAYGMFGLSYMWPSHRRFHLETAIDVFANHESHFRMMAKWISNMTSNIRPYIAAGLGLKILPTDNMAIILTWERLMPHAHAGVDFSLNQHWSLKAEVFMGLDQSLNSYYGLLTGPVISL